MVVEVFVVPVFPERNVRRTSSAKLRDVSHHAVTKSVGRMVAGGCAGSAWVIRCALTAFVMTPLMDAVLCPLLAVRDVLAKPVCVKR